MRTLLSLVIASVIGFGIADAEAGKVKSRSHKKGKSSSSITKCKDENGKWHYGDFAAEQCARTRVTTLNEQGVKIDESDAAMSREESRAKREAESRAKLLKAEKQKEHMRNRRLMMTYESVEHIESARDERLASVDGFIRVDKEFLKRLEDQYVQLESRRVSDPNNGKLLKDIEVTEEQITAYEKSLANRLADREKIELEFNSDIERYQKIRKESPEADTSLGLN